MSSNEKLFYLRDSRTDLGTNVVFWNKDGCGYGTDLDKLEVYTLADAQQHHNCRKSDIPLLKSAVDAASVWAVDCQYLPEPVTDYSERERYVVQVNRRWNGNDIAFVGMNGKLTFSFCEAIVFSLSEIQPRFSESSYHSVYEYQAIKAIARRTFQVENISTCKMITGAGIAYKKARPARPTTGKVRGNCPSCGRITWDYNHECNTPCDDIKCEMKAERWR